MSYIYLLVQNPVIFEKANSFGNHNVSSRAVKVVAVVMTALLIPDSTGLNNNFYL